MVWGCFWLGVIEVNRFNCSFTVQPKGVQESVQKIQKELDEWKRKTDVSIVDSAISTLQLLIAKPSGIFDAYAAIGALEAVVDVAREKTDDRAGRFAIILRQCRPLVGSPTLQQILVKLVASKEEAEVAKVIGKALKDQSGSVRRDPFVGRTRRAPYRVQDGRPRLDCSQPSIFSCFFFFSINERAVRTTRKLDASAKRKKQGGGGRGAKKIEGL